MASYAPPIRDFQFVLHELLDVCATPVSPASPPLDPELIDPILEAAGSFAAEVIAPLNSRGDQEGCTMPAEGVVHTPEGFKDAYTQFSWDGWSSLACDPAHGGQGLPEAVNAAVSEMMTAANFGWAMYPGMSHAAYTCLAVNGSDAQKTTYLPHIASGKWAGTMCMTEPHAGTDLGLLRTRAVRQPDGSYRITGTKIFISGGEQDLTENIVHLVLARIEGAPAGSKGISLFVVPKYLVAADGGLGERNGVLCGSVEHKMGIHGNATCTLNFTDATGWLVGEEHKGLPAMFVMMNFARVGVGISAIGLMEAGFQKSRAYALERAQGHAPVRIAPSAPADPIVAHADVRRLLLTQKAYVEGTRALGIWASQLGDIVRHGATPEQRQRADELFALATPIVKAFSSDLAVECTSLAMQVYGGHGYIVENQVEQHLRDARIIPLYEGTNGVQALDLLGRKVLADDGVKLKLFLSIVAEFAQTQGGTPEMQEFAKPLLREVERLKQSAIGIVKQVGTDPHALGSASAPFLRQTGHVFLAWMWARMAAIAFQHTDKKDPIYAAKIATARFYFQRLLPETVALERTIAAGSASLMEISAEAL